VYRYEERDIVRQADLFYRKHQKTPENSRKLQKLLKTWCGNSWTRASRLVALGTYFNFRKKL